MHKNNKVKDHSLFIIAIVALVAIVAITIFLSNSRFQF